VKVPVALKLSPYFSAVGHLAHELAEAGADGLVLFNRFYHPDLDLETLSVRSDLHLSTRYETGLPLLWIALLAGRFKGSLAATSGVEGAEQVIKYLLMGADAVMSASALLRNGPGHIGTMVRGLSGWLDEHGYPSVAAIRGLTSMRRLDDASALLRAQYMHLLSDYVPGGLTA
jgi:dihydroorotate dehydrogenase (fumarate)